MQVQNGSFLSVSHGPVSSDHECPGMGRALAGSPTNDPNLAEESLGCGTMGIWGGLIPWEAALSIAS